MAWSSGVTRAAGYLVTTQDWNDIDGAAGNLDLLSDGTRIVMPVYESSMEIDNAPSEKKVLVSFASGTGGFKWDGDVDEAITLSFLNM